jgi:hypothetical protein
MNATGGASRVFRLARLQGGPEGFDEAPIYDSSA